MFWREGQEWGGQWFDKEIVESNQPSQQKAGRELELELYHLDQMGQRPDELKKGHHISEIL